MKRLTNLNIVGLALCGMLAGTAGAQFSPFDVPFDAMDDLNSAPVGGANASFNPMDRARGAVGAANQRDPFGAPAAADPFGATDRFGAPAGDPFGGGAAAGGPVMDPFGGSGGFAPVGGGFGGPGGFGTPGGFGALAALAPTSTAWAGERIIDARTGEILQDARKISVLDTFVGDSGRYKDDGKTGNDGVAGDGIYTNITITRDRISPESHVVRSKLIKTLDFVATLSPMEFSQVRVASTEPLSPLPKIVDLETQMDKTIGEWLETFLDDYLSYDEDGMATLLPAFVPAPPRAPNIPLPTRFMPTNPPASDEAGAGGPGATGGFTGAVGQRMGADGIPRDASGVPGEFDQAYPAGTAQSRYF